MQELFQKYLLKYNIVLDSYCQVSPSRNTELIEPPESIVKKPTPTGYTRLRIKASLIVHSHDIINYS